MTKNKITEGNAFSLCINQAVWAEIGSEETPIPANELEDVHLYIGRGPYKAQATEYHVMASGDTLIAYIDHTLKVGMYSTWITAYCNGRRVASNCKEAFEIVSFDEHCSNVVDEVYVCPAIYLQGTTAADEAIRQMQEAERVAAEAERKKTFEALKASFVTFLEESKEQWDAWIAEVRQVWASWLDSVNLSWTTWFDSVYQSWTSWFANVKNEWNAFFTASKAHDEAIQQAEQERASEEAKRQQQEYIREAVTAAAIASLDERENAYGKNELYRADAERGRVQAENERKQGESERNAHELDRIQAEKQREANEEARMNAEASREAAEEQRRTSFESNEKYREKTFIENEQYRVDTFASNESKRKNTFFRETTGRMA